MTKLSVVQFGVAYGGLSTVGYTVYDSNEVEETARTTSGVSEIGTSTGIYRATITLDDGFSGYILWDTGGASPVYTAESVQPLDASQVAAVVSSAVSALGIVAGSLVSAVADATGDDSADARVKLLRLINKKGPDFCNITDWPFMRSDLTFNITTANYIYSGASYLPTTFKRIISSYLKFNNDRYDLDEVGIQEAYNWPNPSNNQGRPDEFCITRDESGYFQIQFNRLPDQTYSIYFEMELQWTDVASITDNVLVTKQYYGAFSHFLTMSRLAQQSDTEGYAIANKEWHDPMTGRGILISALSVIRSPRQRKRVKVRTKQLYLRGHKGVADYRE